MEPTRENACQMIQNAGRHISNDSAMSCYRDALSTYDKGLYGSAIMWAHKSLLYSIGIFGVEKILK